VIHLSGQCRDDLPELRAVVCLEALILFSDNLWSRGIVSGTVNEMNGENGGRPDCQIGKTQIVVFAGSVLVF
jgi:hypothetical protein